MTVPLGSRVVAARSSSDKGFHLSLGLMSQEITIDSIARTQVLVGASIHDDPFIYHQNLVGLGHRAQPVTHDHNAGLGVLLFGLKIRKDSPLCHRVDGAQGRGAE